MNRPNFKCRNCAAIAAPAPTGWDIFNHTDQCRGVVILEPLDGASEGACADCHVTGGHLTRCHALEHDSRFDGMSPEMQERWLSASLEEVPA